MLRLTFFGYEDLGFKAVLTFDLQSNLNALKNGFFSKIVIVLGLFLFLDVEE